MKVQSPSWIRASISFPPSLYGTLVELAKKKKVSLAWVVRDAAEKYGAVEVKEGTGTDGTAQRSVHRTDRYLHDSS